MSIIYKYEYFTSVIYDYAIVLAFEALATTNWLCTHSCVS